MKENIKIVGLAIVSALLIAACGSSSSTVSSTTKSSGSTATSQSSSATKLSFNANGTPNLKGLTFAIGNGASGNYVGDTNVHDLVQYLIKWGAKATQTNAPSPAGELAVVSGKLDSVSSGPPNLIDAGLVIFGPNQTRLDDVVVAKNSITSLADMKGKTVGVGPTASPTTAVLLAALTKAHLTRSQVRTVSIATNTAMERALLAGQIEVGIVPAEDVAKAGKGFHVLAVGATVLPQYADSFTAATSSWLTSHPAMAEAIDLAWLASAKLFQTNEAAWVKNAAVYSQNLDTTAQYQAYWTALQTIQGWPISKSAITVSAVTYNVNYLKQQNSLKGLGLRPVSQDYNLSAWDSAWAQFSAHESAY